jgi:hypothetical protein
MIRVFILTAQMQGGFSYMPMDNLEACQSALAGLAASIATDGQCIPADLAPGSIYAPATSPIPAPRPT